MDNKLLYIFVFIALLLGNVTGFAQEKGYPPGVKGTPKVSAESFYDGDESDIWSSSSIIATNIINTGARINFKATNSIKFTTGFQAFKGASVVAKIETKNASVSTGIDEQNILDRNNDLITVYPNPSNGIIKIETNGLDYPIHLNVYDYTGKLILKREIGQGLEQIDFTSYPKGIYIIKLDVIGKVYTNKITLQ